jgi:hypothetical protein
VTITVLKALTELPYKVEGSSLATEDSVGKAAVICTPDGAEAVAAAATGKMRNRAFARVASMSTWLKIMIWYFILSEYVRILGLLVLFVSCKELQCQIYSSR